jgi:hypothetical protein
MNDAHDNAQTDREMLARLRDIPTHRCTEDELRKDREAAIDSIYGERIIWPHPDLIHHGTITGRFIRPDDLDQWSLPYPPEE